MLTARGVPKRSPIQVLTAPDVVYLMRSDEIMSFQHGVAVNINISFEHAINNEINMK